MLFRSTPSVPTEPHVGEAKICCANILWTFCRFDVKKTFIFIDTDFVDGGHGAAFNYNVRLMGKRTTISQIKGTFGFVDR